MSSPEIKDPSWDCFFCGSSRQSREQSPHTGCRYCQRDCDERYDPDDFLITTDTVKTLRQLIIANNAYAEKVENAVREWRKDKAI